MTGPRSSTSPGGAPSAHAQELDSAPFILRQEPPARRPSSISGCHHAPTLSHLRLDMVRRALLLSPLVSQPRRRRLIASTTRSSFSAMEAREGEPTLRSLSEGSLGGRPTSPPLRCREHEVCLPGSRRESTKFLMSF